jgi:hypothetical protein
MRRTFVRLATATTAVLGAALVAAGPAAAAADPAAPPTGNQHDCRIISVCWPGQHRGWDTPPRNVGG